MFIHLLLQSLYKKTLLYFFLFFFLVSQQHTQNALEIGLLLWKLLFGFLRL